MSNTSGLPQTGDAQDIDQDALRCLYASSPRGWIPKELVGTDDYGLDFQIQLKAAQSVQDIFRVQLKGTRSPILNADCSYFSIALKASTLRFYNNIVEPILLVYCDLSANLDEPAHCPMYYVWVRSELRRIGIETIPFDQGTVTLRVPVANLVTKDLDVLPEIRRANALANIGHALDVKVEIDRPGMNMGDRAELLRDVQTGLTSRSVDFLDAIAEPPTDHWIEPKRGTLAWHLREGNKFIRTGKTEKCKSELALAASLLGSATSIEKADFHHLNGRLRSIEGDSQGARDAHWEASTFEGQPKFLTAWAESELRFWYQLGEKNDFSDILAKLRGNQPSITCAHFPLVGFN